MLFQPFEIKNVKTPNKVENILEKIRDYIIFPELIVYSQDISYSMRLLIWDQVYCNSNLCMYFLLPVLFPYYQGNNS
jgi:hypothetical protein